MERSLQPRKRLWLTISVATNLGVLGIFKYFNFFNANIKELADFIGWNYSVQALSIALPLALSFFTFQALSYSFEVYYGRFKAERHLGVYALYMMFFPKLLVGPIEKPQNLLPQFRGHRPFDYDLAAEGLRQAAWGCIKKFLVADRLALLVNDVYGNPGSYEGPGLAVAVLFYTFQIYYDFSGYTDIALGIAKILGYRLTQNFAHPNFARSIGNFWRRWHLSLSSWFRTYLYIPLGGNRSGYARQCVNIAVVFLATGFWHGASWTFIVWGGLHGFFIILELTYKRFVHKADTPALPGPVGTLLAVALTFTLVALTRVFFRSHDIPQALYVLSHLTEGWNLSVFTPAGLQQQFTAMTADKLQILYGALGIAAIELCHVVQVKRPALARVAGWPGVIRWPVYYAVLYLILFGQLGQATQFIYFKF